MKKNVLLINIIMIPILLSFQNCTQGVQFSSTPDVIKKVGDQQPIQIINTDNKQPEEELIVDNGAQDRMPDQPPAFQIELPPGNEYVDIPSIQILGDKLCSRFFDDYTAQLNLIDNGCFEHTDNRRGHQTNKVLNQLVNGQWDVYASLPGSKNTDSWVTEHGNGIEVQRNTVVKSHSGNHYIELDSHGRNSNSKMSQTVDIMQPGNYRLAFYYLPRVSGANDNSIDVLIDDEVISTVSGSAQSLKDNNKTLSGWKLIIIDLKGLTAGPLKLSFSAVTEADRHLTYGGLLDDISLVPLLE